MRHPRFPINISARGEDAVKAAEKANRLVAAVVEVLGPEDQASLRIALRALALWAFGPGAHAEAPYMDEADEAEKIAEGLLR